MHCTPPPTPRQLQWLPIVHLLTSRLSFIVTETSQHLLQILNIILNLRTRPVLNCACRKKCPFFHVFCILGDFFSHSNLMINCIFFCGVTNSEHIYNCFTQALTYIWGAILSKEKTHAFSQRSNPTTTFGQVLCEI